MLVNNSGIRIRLFCAYYIGITFFNREWHPEVCFHILFEFQAVYERRHTGLQEL